MAERNRVTPGGDIVAIDQRGLFMGNRGSIHRVPSDIARPWQVRRWITCRLEYKGWVAPKWQPGRWTPLFFWDEAVALAAGHRPCALCRRSDFNRWMDAWEAAFGERPTVDPMDRVMHADRVEGRGQRHHRRPWSDLPAGTFALLASSSGSGTSGSGSAGSGSSGSSSGLGSPGSGSASSGSPGSGSAVPVLVLGDRVVPWSPGVEGYGASWDRPVRGDAVVLTPASTVEVLRAGYRPVVHPAAGDGAGTLAS